MGYSADVIDIKADEDFVIPNERRQELYDAMLAVEAAETGAGTYAGGVFTPHISWCHRVDTYGPERVHEILEHYGFTIFVAEASTGDIVVEGWGGDKLGSSHDAMMEALAPFAPKATWVWLGEDGERWATRWDGEGGFKVLNVVMTIEEDQ